MRSTTMIKFVSGKIQVGHVAQLGSDKTKLNLPTLRLQEETFSMPPLTGFSLSNTSRVAI